MKVAIINRSFWPVYPVIGEALLRLAERLTKKNLDVYVCFQDQRNFFQDKLKKAGRGKGVNFKVIRSFSISSSSVIKRIFDAFIFSFLVFLFLIKHRPRLVYISTDPPIFTPLIVNIYCLMFSANYIYHLQDIHPEATSLVKNINPYVYKILVKIDAYIIRNSLKCITLNQEMKSELLRRTNNKGEVDLIFNPSVDFKKKIDVDEIKHGFSFCGNLGRFQRVPLLVEAIESYLKLGGGMQFTFAGSGLYANMISDLSNKYKNVSYEGVVSSDRSAEIIQGNSWAILPIDDKVTKYAFPSKASSYAYSGASIIAICNKDNSVAKWVIDNKLGIVSKPNANKIVKSFFEIEKMQIKANKEVNLNFKNALSMDKFVDSLSKLFTDQK